MRGNTYRVNELCKYARTGIALLLCATAAVLSAACLLGDDIKTLWKKAVGDNSGIVPGATLAAKLKWLESNAQNRCNYIIELSADESIDSSRLFYTYTYIDANVTITLKGIGANRIISLSSRESRESMFTVGNNVTLVLDNNITLQGRNDNTDSLVRVNEGGVLLMNAGSAITGNTVSNYSYFNGGGVYVSGGTFTMNGGTISGNSVNSSNSPNSNACGGGVYVNDGTFSMNSGIISGNTAKFGSGVYVSRGTFTMNDGAIFGNTASSSGGGVYVNGGTFTMNSGTISGNTASSGGGMYVGGGTFTKTGGTIYGYSVSDTVNSNAVKDSDGMVLNERGHAVYVSTGSVTKRRESTAGPWVSLSFNYNNGSPTWSGEWDN